MKGKGWEKIPVVVTDPSTPGTTRTVEAIAPVIISASRSTDIPAFYGDWFMARLKAGYVQWKNPFGGSPVFVSFARARLFVFWSKNPAPFLLHLDTLDRQGFSYYFLYTLNNYGPEGLEPGIPPLDERIETFIRLSRKIGKGRVVWRFDPLVLSDTLPVPELLDRIRQIGDRIAPFTERLVFSFVDIDKYVTVRRNLRHGGFPAVREFTDEEITRFCTGLSELNKRWGLALSACGESRDLSRYGIVRGGCICPDLITDQFGDDRELREFLHPPGQQALESSMTGTDPFRRLRDPGQRNTCRCIASKDIGQYSTCMHLCAYCYANSSADRVTGNYSRYIREKDRGLFNDTITG